MYMHINADIDFGIFAVRVGTNEQYDTDGEAT